MQNLLKYISIFIFVGISPVFSQSVDENYIKTTLIKTAGLTRSVPDNSVIDMLNIKKQNYISYYDGLGRETQNIFVKGSPSQNDIVKFHEYDITGKESQVWLPLTRAGNYDFGEFCPNVLEKSKEFYADEKPYSDIIYDNSALNRIVEKIPEGNLYHELNKSVKIDYSTNDANEIIKWKVVNDQCVKDTTPYFTEGSLRVTEITDENGNKTREYSNLSGQIIVKSALLKGYWLKTYYVFDDFGLLRFVIPPQASSKIEQNNATFQSIAGQYCYSYKYDNKKRLIEKKLPGTAPIYMVYDKRDLPVAVQDGNMRKKHLWMFTKYDVFKRPIIKGVIKTNADLSDMQTTLDNFYEQNDSPPWEEKCSSGYTNHAYPDITMNNILGISGIIWYDDYTHPANNAHYIAYPQIDAKHDTTRSFKGLTTFTQTQISGTNQYIKTSIFYDEYNRAIQSQTTNSQNTPGQLYYLDIISNEYDFTGKITKTLQHHRSEKNKSSNSEVNIKILNEFTYDHADRLLQTRETLYLRDNIISSAVTQLNQYNERGELEKKYLHEIEDGSFLQEQTYKYNLRGWLTAINDPQNLDENLFAQKLFYENGATPQYNGNISSMIWNTQRKNHSRYNFRYDALNRLIKAKYTPKGNYNTEYSYDLNGNITRLKRKAMIHTIKHPSGLKKRTIDNLKYQYSGNQLFSVQDKLTEVCENYGFLNNGSSVKGQNTGGNYTNDREYYYDANGNLIKDRNKGIEGIEYNLLNLPKRILYKQNNAIYYTYDASGVKWAKEIHKDGGIKRFDYLGNFVYEDHVLKYIITDYGKIVVSKVNNPFIRYYDLRDHLGNVRASFRANDNNTFTLLQEDSYYPFGMQQPAMSYLSRDTEHKNLHLYNGKELQTDFDLNWYDYGARFYDVELGRWHVVDALAEKRNWLSPYNYVQNSPIMRVDPDGRLDDWVQNKETGKYEWKDNVTSVDNTPENYRYVGTNDKDILTDLNLTSKFSTKTDSRTSFGLDGDNVRGTSIGTNVNVSGNINVYVEVIYDKDNVSDNNVYGKTFKGVTFEANFQQSSKSPNSDLAMKYKGYFGVQYGDKTYYSILKKPIGTYIYEAGTNLSQAKISILSSNMNRLKIFKSAYISVGVTNPSLFVSPKPIKLLWNLMQNSVFLPKQ